MSSTVSPPPGARAAETSDIEMPLLAKERIWNFRQFSGMNVMLAIATWAFLQGGAVALYVGAEAAVASILIGYGIGALLVSLAPCLPVAKYGVEMYVALRSVFGVTGAKLVMIVMSVLVMAAWTALLSIMVGHAMVNVYDEVTDSSSASSNLAIAGVALVAVFVTWALLLGGAKTVGKVGNLAAPILIVITVGMLVLIFTEVSWSELTSAPALYPMEDQHMAFILAIELNIAGALAWYPSVGNLVRLTDSPRASFWPNAIGFFGASSFGAIVGAFAALTLGSDDPTVWMIPLGGAVLGIAALGFIAFANLTSMMAMAYSGISAVTGFSPWMRKVRWSMISAGFLIPVAIICLFPEAVYDNYGRFVSWVAIIVAPMCGIHLVDFFILRRTRLSVRDLYRGAETSAYAFWGGWNIVAFVALVSGAATYYLLLHPVLYAPGPGFEFLGASVPAALVAGTVHWIGTIVVTRRVGRGGYYLPEDAM